MTSGNFAAALLIYILLANLFRRRMFGLFDPLSLFLFCRIAVPLAFLMLAAERFALHWAMYLWACFFVFCAAMYGSAKPSIGSRPIPVQQLNLLRARTYRWLWFLFGLKCLVLGSVVTSLPVFAEGGANAYIDFDQGDKWVSTVLFGLGMSDFILACALFPGTAGKTRLVLVAIILVSGVSPLLMGKKSSILTVLVALAVARYLHATIGRGVFIQARRQVVGALALFGAAVLWAAWVFSRSGDDITLADLDSFSGVLDFVAYQWTHVYDILFAQDIIASFVAETSYNPLTYFFHSFLKVLGSGAFEYGLGPALGGHVYGVVTGQGVNPTFVVEGYVLFGYAGGIVFAAVSGLLMGWARSWMDRAAPTSDKAVLVALFMQSLLTWPVDTLLFVKMAAVSLSLYLAGTCLFRMLRALSAPARNESVYGTSRASE